MTSRSSRSVFLVCVFAAMFIIAALGQSTSTITGTVRDSGGAVINGAKVTVTNVGTGLDWKTQTDATGNYQVTALPTGTYKLEVSAPSMQKQVLTGFVVEVSRTLQQNFTLKVASATEEVMVTGEAPVIEASTMTVGTVINEKTVQEIPLNGRHFVDLGLLVPGTVAPPQAGFLTAPLRGQGSFAINTAGQREDTVNFMINGINLNDMVQNQITFQPSINTVEEFKLDNSTYSAEYGRNSGAIANIATRSGTNAFHGELFEFLKNDWFDAKNYFANSAQPNAIPPFKRNNFGAAIGGPIIRNKTFFFASYEGTRQRQGITVNQTVLDSAQRTAVSDPVSQKLLPFIPAANALGGPGVCATLATNCVFTGAATAPVDIDQWTGDVSHRLGESDTMHFYYAFQKDHRGEPVLQGNNIPNFGDTRQSHRQIGTWNYAHTFSPNIVNEARIGFNRIHITFEPNNPLDPTTLGMSVGYTGPIGIPQITIGGIGLNMGGPAGFPQGRDDTTYVVADTLSWQKGRHSLHFGTELRRFNNNNFTGDTGTAAYSTLAAFQNGDLNSFSVTPGTRPSRIFAHSFAGFVQDSFKMTSYLTLELGLRYDFNKTPTEGANRFVVFDPATSSLVRVGTNGLDNVYDQNNKNFQPRVGFAWDVFHDGSTVLRGGYAIMTDQPITNAVTALASNPPFAATASFAAGPVKFGNAFAAATGAGVTINTIDRNFRNPYVQSYNLNIQRQLPGQMVMMVGYFGSKGTHLRLSVNENQPIAGVKPFPILSATSPIRPVSCPALPLDCALNASFTQITSKGNSNYNALWVTANKRFAKGLQFNTSYTWSKSLDYNSLSSDGIRVVDGYNPRRDYGPSDFDARHRFVASVIYELPFKGNRLIQGWQVGTITQAQSGNPIANIVVNGVNVTGATPASGLNNTNAFTGVNNLRPDLLQPIHITGDPLKWLANTTVCDPRITAGPGLCTASSVFAVPVSAAGVFHFGNMGRNSIVGPNFVNTDFSIIKNTKITERFTHEFRFAVYDLFNHPNFGNPGRTAQVGSTAFMKVTNTRFGTGDPGSSRQLEFAMKLKF
jgi:outer membrane receptor protein involved in Fe transport